MQEKELQRRLAKNRNILYDLFEQVVPCEN
jgi:hypothetical protein